ncbi:PQQ-dependent sugar dehydrogenase [Schlesneria paludicola]|uniref:PQQ-dependent sugar dehydrogenase n=1 Tax=Schlesneria paludicola TaxID=360056 RepID=UPI00029A81F6|nr:PQQ-dependent sugar dehydrogenase [Schlesneria paludicola]
MVWAPIALALMFAMPVLAAAAEPVKPASSFDTHQRVPWTTGNLQGSPDLPDPYTTERAFPKLKFVEPLSVGLVPGYGRFGVATRPGKIFTFEIRSDVNESQLLIDLQKTTYGLVFHPQFAQNGFFYLTYIHDDDPEIQNGSRLSRFHVPPGGPLIADPRTEQVLLEWPAGGHNGGCIRFGPDGYLYLATGDGSGIADGRLTGQDISDLLASILRIDVDHVDPGLAYFIPRDNPFVGVKGARGEVWAYGLRQVWKFSFDGQQRLWAGEVGQDLWEMIDLIQRGGNYGWSVKEGNHPFRPERPQGPTEIIPPLVEHNHADFRSITGGYVARSSRLPELNGAYVYGDYDTGKVWSLRLTGENVTEHHQLTDTQIRIVEFAHDLEGDVYLVDFAGGGFHRLVKSNVQVSTKPFPKKLSETGLFDSTKDLIPAQGLIPYSVNAPLWSDGAEKDRFLAIPGNSTMEFDTVVYPHGPDYADRGWRFPDGTVLVKTFSIDMEQGNPSSRRRLETRLLKFHKMPGDDDEYGAQLWLGYTYVWNDDQTDAELLDASGLDRVLTIQDAAAPGGQRQQVWRFPSRTECALCHTMASKYVLGVSTLQMNKTHNYGGVVANQLDVLNRLGLFVEKLPKPADELPRLVDYQDLTADLNLRARSYLHANCAHCHRKWGGGNADFELQASIPVSQTMTVNTRPGQGRFNLTDPRILVPGEPQRSLILERMKLEGLGRMPHVASRVVDEKAIAILTEWIASLNRKDALETAGAIHPRIPEVKAGPAE